MRQVPAAEPLASRGLSRWAQGVKVTTRRVTSTRGAGFGLVWVLFAIVVASIANLVAPYGPNAQDYDTLLQPPTLAHPFGTDHVGRDILSRVVFGARVSLSAGIIA